jgi:hypothetical protein
MIPVKQTKFGYGHGNCFEACVASILEIPLEEVCDIPHDDKTWFDVFDKWMRSRGFLPIMTDDIKNPPKGYSIAGITVTGCPHACVALDGKIVFDPQVGTPLNLPVEDYLYWETFP